MASFYQTFDEFMEKECKDLLEKGGLGDDEVLRLAELRWDDYQGNGGISKGVMGNFWSEDKAVGESTINLLAPDEIAGLLVVAANPQEYGQDEASAAATVLIAGAELSTGQPLEKNGNPGDTIKRWANDASALHQAFPKTRRLYDTSKSLNKFDPSLHPRDIGHPEASGEFINVSPSRSGAASIAGASGRLDAESEGRRGRGKPASKFTVDDPAKYTDVSDDVLGMIAEGDGFDNYTRAAAQNLLDQRVENAELGYKEPEPIVTAAQGVKDLFDDDRNAYFDANEGADLTAAVYDEAGRYTESDVESGAFYEYADITSDEELREILRDPEESFPAAVKIAAGDQLEERLAATATPEASAAALPEGVTREGDELFTPTGDPMGSIGDFEMGQMKEGDWEGTMIRDSALADYLGSETGFVEFPSEEAKAEFLERQEATGGADWEMDGEELGAIPVENSSRAFVAGDGDVEEALAPYDEPAGEGPPPAAPPPAGAGLAAEQMAAGDLSEEDYQAVVDAAQLHAPSGLSEDEVDGLYRKLKSEGVSMTDLEMARLYAADDAGELPSNVSEYLREEYSRLDRDYYELRLDRSPELNSIGEGVIHGVPLSADQIETLREAAADGILTNAEEQRLGVFYPESVDEMPSMTEGMKNIMDRPEGQSQEVLDAAQAFLEDPARVQRTLESDKDYVSPQEVAHLDYLYETDQLGDEDLAAVEARGYTPPAPGAIFTPEEISEDYGSDAQLLEDYGGNTDAFESQLMRNEMDARAGIEPTTSEERLGWAEEQDVRSDRDLEVLGYDEYSEAELLQAYQGNTDAFDSGRIRDELDRRAGRPGLDVGVTEPSDYGSDQELLERYETSTDAFESQGLRDEMDARAGIEPTTSEERLAWAEDQDIRSDRDLEALDYSDFTEAELLQAYQGNTDAFDSGRIRDELDRKAGRPGLDVGMPPTPPPTAGGGFTAEEVAGFSIDELGAHAEDARMSEGIRTGWVQDELARRGIEYDADMAEYAEGVARGSLDAGELTSDELEFLARSEDVYYPGGREKAQTELDRRTGGAAPVGGTPEDRAAVIARDYEEQYDEFAPEVSGMMISDADTATLEVLAAGGAEEWGDAPEAAQMELDVRTAETPPEGPADVSGELARFSSGDLDAFEMSSTALDSVLDNPDDYSAQDVVNAGEVYADRAGLPITDVLDPVMDRPEIAALVRGEPSEAPAGPSAIDRLPDLPSDDAVDMIAAEGFADMSDANLEAAIGDPDSIPLEREAAQFLMEEREAMAGMTQEELRELATDPLASVSAAEYAGVQLESLERYGMEAPPGPGEYDPTTGQVVPSGPPVEPDDSELASYIGEGSETTYEDGLEAIRLTNREDYASEQEYNQAVLQRADEIGFGRETGFGPLDRTLADPADAISADINAMGSGEVAAIMGDPEDPARNEAAAKFIADGEGDLASVYGAEYEAEYVADAQRAALAGELGPRADTGIEALSQNELIEAVYGGTLDPEQLEPHYQELSERVRQANARAVGEVPGVPPPPAGEPRLSEVQTRLEGEEGLLDPRDYRDVSDDLLRDIAADSDLGSMTTSRAEGILQERELSPISTGYQPAGDVITGRTATEDELVASLEDVGHPMSVANEAIGDTRREDFESDADYEAGVLDRAEEIAAGASFDTDSEEGGVPDYGAGAEFAQDVGDEAAAHFEADNPAGAISALVNASDEQLQALADDPTLVSDEVSQEAARQLEGRQPPPWQEAISGPPATSAQAEAAALRAGELDTFEMSDEGLDEVLNNPDDYSAQVVVSAGEVYADRAGLPITDVLDPVMDRPEIAALVRGEAAPEDIAPPSPETAEGLVPPSEMRQETLDIADAVKGEWDAGDLGTLENEDNASLRQLANSPGQYGAQLSDEASMELERRGNPPAAAWEAAGASPEMVSEAENFSSKQLIGVGERDPGSPEASAAAAVLSERAFDMGARIESGQLGWNDLSETERDAVQYAIDRGVYPEELGQAVADNIASNSGMQQGQYLDGRASAGKLMGGQALSETDLNNLDRASGAGVLSNREMNALDEYTGRGEPTEFTVVEQSIERLAGGASYYQLASGEQEAVDRAFDAGTLTPEGQEIVARSRGDALIRGEPSTPVQPASSVNPSAFGETLEPEEAGFYQGYYEDAALISDSPLTRDDVGEQPSMPDVALHIAAGGELSDETLEDIERMVAGGDLGYDVGERALVAVMDDYQRSNPEQMERVGIQAPPPVAPPPPAPAGPELPGGRGAGRYDPDAPPVPGGPGARYAEEERQRRFLRDVGGEPGPRAEVTPSGMTMRGEQYGETTSRLRTGMPLNEDDLNYLERAAARDWLTAEEVDELERRLERRAGGGS